jgi:hypothetical protein
MRARPLVRRWPAPGADCSALRDRRICPARQAFLLASHKAQRQYQAKTTSIYNSAHGYFLHVHAPPRMHSKDCGLTSRQVPGRPQPNAETMQALHEGVFPVQASGFATQFGVSEGAELPASPIGSVPGYRPRLTHISPSKQVRAPQATPPLPAPGEQSHAPARGEVEAWQVQLCFDPALSQYVPLV